MLSELEYDPIELEDDDIELETEEKDNYDPKKEYDPAKNDINRFDAEVSAITLPIGLISKWRYSKMLVVPKFQRDAGIWPEHRKEILVVSIIQNEKIQPLTLSSRKKPSSVVYYRLIDGLQRITTLALFMNNEFSVSMPEKISGNAVNVFYDKKDLDNNERRLSTKSKSLFDDYPLSFIVYMGLTDMDEIRLFAKIQNSNQLSPCHTLNFMYYYKRGIHTIGVSTAHKLREGKVLDDIINMKSEHKKERSKYNSMCTCIVMNFISSSINRNKTKKKKIYFDFRPHLDEPFILKEEHYKLALDEYYRDGSGLYDKIVNVSDSVRKLGVKSLNIRDFIKIFYNVYLTDHEDKETIDERLKKAISVLRSIKDLLNENELKEFKDTVEACVTLKGFKEAISFTTKSKDYQIAMKRTMKTIGTSISSINGKNWTYTRLALIGYLECTHVDSEEE